MPEEEKSEGGDISRREFLLNMWQPKVASRGVVFPDQNIVVTGKEFREAEDNLNSLSMQNLSGDGLPIIPPTNDRVDWIMTGTELAPDHVLPGLGTLLAQGGPAVVRSLAIILAMSGGRPEYLPVLLAMVEAMTSNSPATQDWKLSELNSTTRSIFPAAIVSGTIGNQIRLNSGYGCLGPDPRHPANASIGRAAHLVLAILGGAVAGIGSMSTFGGMRFTNAVFAEDELGVPKDWPTLGEDRGFERGENVVTVEPIGNWYCENISTTSGGDTLEGSLDSMLPWLTARAADNTRQDPDRSNGFIMFPDTFANLLHDAGYSKQKVKQYLFDHQLANPWPKDKIGICTTWDAKYALNPAQICLVIAGGAQAQDTYIMNSTSMSSCRVSKPISLPKNWDALLAQAETDWGPNPGHTD
jgi:hypothetical protein